MRRELIGGTVGIALMVAVLSVRSWLLAPPSKEAETLIQSLQNSNDWVLSESGGVWNTKSRIGVRRREYGDDVLLVNDHDTGHYFSFGISDRWRINFALNDAIERIEAEKIKTLTRDMPWMR